MINLSTYLQNYKIGDYVDIKVNSAVHKGMPYKFYHGKTGRVWNVTKRAVGVEVNKVHRNRVIAKRIHERVEPRGAFTLTAVEPQTITPVPYDIEKVVAKRE